uniref:RING-type E3 ubiquitin transferase n=1 Tax=Solanum lycopersicum TaxID=4081 RepID=K4CCC4_SOLLC
MVRNPYCWTIEHQKDLPENDDQNLSKGKLFILCGIRKVYLNYYFTQDGSWRFYDRTYFIYENTRRLCFGHDHEEANEDELGLIEEQVAMDLMTLEETRVFMPVVPTSKDAIEGLGKVKVETLNGDKSFGETCMICLGKLITKDIVELTRMPCKHVFYGDCIIQWLEINHVCPLCRFRMPIDKEN